MPCYPQSLSASSWLSAVSELERRARALELTLPSRASLKTQVSRWENCHVSPDDLYASLLAEIYETTPLDLELGLRGRTPAAPRPLGATPTGPGSGEWLRCMEAVLAEYARTDNEVGPGSLIRGVTQHLAQLEQMALAARGPIREEAFRLCSRFAEFAGWLCQDAGDLLEAERWTDRALDYAEHGGDEHSRAYILMRKSTIAVERRECARAVALAAAASRAPEGKPSHLQALLFRQLAISHALASEASESERAADKALAAASDGGERVNPAHAYCTLPYVLMETGIAAVRRGDVHLGAERLSAASDAWPQGFTRDQGLCLARLAVAEAARGDIDGACDAGRRAVDVASVAASARTGSVLRSLDRRLEPHRRLTVVSEFLSYRRKD